MADSDKNNFFPFGDWKHFEELFKGVSKLTQSKPQDLKVQDFAWVDKFITNVMKNTPIPNAAANAAPAATPKKGKLDIEVFETHRSVLVKVTVPNGIHPRKLQIYVNSFQVKIIGPEDNDLQYVKLPAAVHSNSSKAEFLDGILQIQLRKKTKSERYDEVFIRFL